MKDPFLLRRDRLVRLMKKNRLDLLLITNFTNVTYLTGFTGDDSYLLMIGSRAVIISDPRYANQIAEETFELEALIRSPGVGMNAAIQNVLKPFLDKPGTVLGVEADSLTLAQAGAIQSALSGVTLRPVHSAVEMLREIKDSVEIAAIRDAVRIAERGFEIIRASLTPAQTETEIRDDLEYQMRKMGADDRGFSTIAAVGERAALPHAVPVRSRRVADGNHLLIDWGAKKNLYVSDLTRVLITAKPSLKLKKIYEAVLQAQKAALETIRPGVLSNEPDAAARRVIEAAGYGKEFNHSLGHGIGLVVHDRGHLSMNNPVPLRPGMVLTVEPGIYIPSFGGVRIEDDVLVTRSGVEILSDGFPKEFEEMIVRF